MTTAGASTKQAYDLCMGLPPCPGPAPLLAHRGPPDDLSVRPRVAYRPWSVDADYPWHYIDGATASERALFADRWGHDFEVKVTP